MRPLASASSLSTTASSNLSEDHFGDGSLTAATAYPIGNFARHPPAHNRPRNAIIPAAPIVQSCVVTVGRAINVVAQSHRPHNQLQPRCRPHPHKRVAENLFSSQPLAVHATAGQLPRLHPIRIHRFKLRRSCSRRSDSAESDSAGSSSAIQSPTQIRSNPRQTLQSATHASGSDASIQPLPTPLQFAPSFSNPLRPWHDLIDIFEISAPAVKQAKHSPSALAPNIHHAIRPDAYIGFRGGDLRPTSCQST